MLTAALFAFAGLCPWHGPLGHGAVATYESGLLKGAPGAGGGDTMVVQITDHLNVAKNAEHRPSEGALRLGVLQGYDCAVMRVVGEDGPAVPLYELSCAGKDGDVERLRHRCDPSDPGLAPEMVWNGLNPMGMTVVTIALTCR